jgi:hypothetical protein
MKKLIGYSFIFCLTFILSISAITNAVAQRGGGRGGFRGGVHTSSGFGIHANYSAHSYVSYSYRSGLGYHLGYGYRVGAFYRPGFGYFGYPHLGFYCGILPFGYYPFYWGTSLYYYSGGVFYAPYDGGGYQVTAPPIGAAVPDLPKNAVGIKIDGVQYYEANGVYFKEGTDDKGQKVYIVTGRDGVLNTAPGVTDPNASNSAPKVGDIVNQLPDNCRKILLNGKKYFVSPNDIYYEKVVDPQGNTGYRITSLPEPENEKGV